MEQALARAEARLDEIESASEASKKQVLSLEKRLAEQGQDAGEAVRMLARYAVSMLGENAFIMLMTDLHLKCLTDQIHK